MEHTITQYTEWPKGHEVSYHDWIIKASKEEIVKKLGFKPKYNRSGDKWTYQWMCNLDNGRFFFTIYDMSYGRFLGKDEVTEFHIGFDDNFDSIHNFYPSRLEALEMIEALEERDLVVDHAELWKRWHDDGTFDDIERLVKQYYLGS